MGGMDGMGAALAAGGIGAIAFCPGVVPGEASVLPSSPESRSPESTSSVPPSSGVKTMLGTVHATRLTTKTSIPVAKSALMLLVSHPLQSVCRNLIAWPHVLPRAMLRVVRTACVIPLLLTGFLACSSSTSSGSSGSGSGGDAGGDGAAGVCAASTPQLDAKLETYDAGMAQWGASKVFQFILEDSSPAPVSAGSSLTWTIEILDASGKPVTGADFTTVHPWMPVHMHGTSEVMVTAGSKPGTYVLQPLYFFMPGVWETDLTVKAGGQTDSTSYFFCMM